MVLKLGRFGQYSRNIWKVLKWCLRRMGVSWTDNVRNEEVLLRVKEQRKILHDTTKRTADSIGHILRRNCLLQRTIEKKIKGGIEVTWRRGRRRRNLLDYFRKGEDTLIWRRKLWIALCGELALEEVFRPVVRQTTKWMNEYETYFHIPDALTPILYFILYILCIQTFYFFNLQPSISVSHIYIQKTYRHHQSATIPY
jgi:hypothetical protein